MTPPDDVDAETTAARATRSDRIRRARRAVHLPVRGRWSAVGVVAVVVIGVAVLSAASPAPSAAPAPGTGDGVAVPPADALMSSAFCTTGGGPIGAHSTIYLTNTSTVPVRATMTSIGEANPHGVVPTVRRMLAVPATGTLAVDPATGLPAGTTATTFAFDGGGVVASQVAPPRRATGSSSASSTPPPPPPRSTCPS
jgi:hypothetical protein